MAHGWHCNAHANIAHAAVASKSLFIAVDFGLFVFWPRRRCKFHFNEIGMVMTQPKYGYDSRISIRMRTPAEMMQMLVSSCFNVLKICDFLEIRECFVLSLFEFSECVDMCVFQSF